MTRACAFNDNTYVYTVAPGMISNALERYHPDFASCEFAAGLTAGLKATGFGCDIPSGATILGVEVLIEKSGTRNNSNGGWDAQIQLHGYAYEAGGTNFYASAGIDNLSPYYCSNA